MTNIKLTGIYIYPIKSAAGFSWETAEVTKQGFQYDRRWMLVDKTGMFITQRQVPRLALIRVEVKGDYLIVNAPNQDTLSIPIHLDILDRVSVQVWRDICEAIPLGKEVSQWFTQFLGIYCQLVYMPENSLRPVNANYATNNDAVSFADGFPFLLISEASLEDLNSRLDQSIPMNRFRPNLVVSGCDAFAEDSWRSIRIGSIPFRVVKPCERCVVTTVDQATGIRGKEPLSTLTKYRNQQGKILFGQNLIQEQLGTLKVGDLVEIELGNW